MDQFNTPTTRTVQLTAPGWITRLLALFIFIFLAALGFIIALPLIFLGFLIFVYLRIKRLFTRAHKPNGPLDGRRNVRVLDRDD